MNQGDVMSLTHPIKLLGMTVVLSSIAVSTFSMLMAGSGSEADNMVPTAQVELWKVQ